MSKTLTSRCRAYAVRPAIASGVHGERTQAASATGQALHRRPAVHEHERRPGAGVFRGWRRGGHHHRPFALQMAVRDRSEFQSSRTKDKPADVKQVGRELGVRYVLEGSIRKAAGRVRITGQLIEAATGHHVWADRFEGALEDIFALQDEVTSSVVGALAPSLEQAEIERARGKPTESLDAYDNYLRGLAGIIEEARRGWLRRCRFFTAQSNSIRNLLRRMACWRSAIPCALANGWMIDPERRSQRHCGLPARRSIWIAMILWLWRLADKSYHISVTSLENGAAFIRQALAAKSELRFSVVFSRVQPALQG